MSARAQPFLSQRGAPKSLSRTRFAVAKAASPPFPKAIKRFRALCVFAVRDYGKAALRMSARTSIDPESDFGFTPRSAKFGLLALLCITSIVWLSSRALLSTNFLPHWYCFVGNKRLLWTTVIADLLIGLSYVAISTTLAWLVRRAGRDLPYSGFFWAFGLFIVSCGVTHFFEIVTVWKPVYWLSAAAKVVTAAASVGTAIVLLIAADDIVEFVRTAREAASQRGNERFRALIQATPMPVISSDLGGNVTAWNPAAERVFGWRAEEVLGKLAEIVPEDKAQELAELSQKTMLGQATLGLETTRINRQRLRFPASVSIAPVFNEEGIISGLVEVIEDTSERYKAELEQARLEAQVRQAQKMEVLGRLAGGVAHDFNNLLMVLGGCSELLERSLPKESGARVYLDQIQRTTEKATAITRQLLAFSRKQVLEIRAMDLHAALTASEFMLPRLLGSDIDLTFRHEAADSWILSDPAQIEQVIMNLAVNSRDAMPDGGRLIISTRNARSLPDDAAGAKNQNWVALEVEDTGTGMDDQTRARIFEPFFTTKPDGKGTGLGLSTVYGIVRQSDGHIQVESKVGQGTRFVVFFPATEAQLAAQTDASPATNVIDSGIDATILVADDESALRHAIVEILRTSGYKVLEAETSTEALELARQHQGQLDILLTDIVMPGLRGPELARRVAKAHPEVQIVYMSGYAEGLPEAQLPANATFLQKPFRFATLLQQLKLVRRKV
jgi:two-component system, cell cycle sensor histidine kinase and response regulator CckA